MVSSALPARLATGLAPLLREPPGQIDGFGFEF